LKKTLEQDSETRTNYITKSRNHNTDKTQGLNTEINKLNNITRGSGKSETPEVGEPNKQQQLQGTSKHGRKGQYHGALWIEQKGI